jgi:hypothetical protein
MLQNAVMGGYKFHTPENSPANSDEESGTGPPKAPRKRAIHSSTAATATPRTKRCTPRRSSTVPHAPVRKYPNASNAQSSPSGGRVNTNGCIFHASFQAPTSRNLVARVMPHPGHGSPSARRTGHGHGIGSTTNATATKTRSVIVRLRFLRSPSINGTISRGSTRPCSAPLARAKCCRSE